MTEMHELDLPEVGDNRRMGWVSDIAAEMLRRLGIRYIALNPGASYRGLHDSLVNYLGNRDPQMLLCLHEDHPIAIAHGYAKVTGEPMAAVVHSNVGLMHGLMSVFNAWCDRMPIYLLGATGPVDAARRRPWIDWIHTAKDQGALLRNFTKWDDEPRSPEALVESMLRGAVMARTPPQGPVYLCLDAGMQESELSEPIEIPDVARFAPGEPQAASARAAEQAADLLLEAKRPLLLMGRMSRSQEDWDNRRRLAELLGAGVISDIKTAATFPTDHPLHVGAPSLWPHEERNAALREADAVLSLDWVDLDGTFKSAGLGKDVPAKVICCSVDIHAHNGWSMDHFGLAPSDLTVHADPDRFVAQLLPLIEARLDDTPRWSGDTRPPTAMPRPERADDAPLSTTDIGLALDAARNSRRLTLTRVTLGWDASVYPFREPLDYTGHDGGAGLGSAPGITIGVGLALKGTGRLPVAVMGDGEFMHGVSALWTAARYKIPALFVIANNRSNFNDEIHQETTAKLRGRPIENKWIGQRIDDPAIDIAALARAQGIEADGPVKTWDALERAIETGLAAVEDGGPYLIDVWIEPGYSTPLVTRG
ncbi:MAG: thiamine pyrophosphate-binding protein [Alphaproteobacteria bacterium]|nr:thiamine pyrophosphate-binding protein [Alphaproteobacteria bacterium]